jgi:hypothetical protein
MERTESRRGRERKFSSKWGKPALREKEKTKKEEWELKKKTLLVATLLIALLSLIDPGQSGYVWTGVHWPKGSKPSIYYESEVVDTMVDNYEMHIPIYKGFMVWEDAAGRKNIDFYFGKIIPNDDKICDENGKNEIRLHSPLSNPQWIAETTVYRIPGTNIIKEVDITFDKNRNWGYNPDPEKVDPDKYDVWDVAAHEVGHLIGLFDVTDEKQKDVTMYYLSARGQTYRRDLHPDDIEGLKAIYGTLENATDVGGIVVPVDKLTLLAPYIGLASTTIIAAVVTIVYVKRVKHRKEKQ